MSEQQQRFRRMLWVTGSVLWVIVFAWLFVIQRSSRTDLLENEQTSKKIAAGVASDDGAAKPIWDPQGIEDFELVERDGRKVTKADLLGQPWAVCFIFTHCQGTCPRIAGQFQQLQNRVRDADVRLVSLSVDPKRDTPEVLQKYAAVYRADPQKWWFLTGDQQIIYRLIQRSFKLPVAESRDSVTKPGFEVIHSNFVLHVDALGRVVQKYDAMKDTDMIRLQRALLAEASELHQSSETVGTPPLGPPGGIRKKKD